jgi:hypothetical protein
MPVTVTLATFPLPDRAEPYWQVNVGGMPVIRETTSQADAAAAFERTVRDMSAHGRQVVRMFWDGFNAQETAL